MIPFDSPELPAALQARFDAEVAEVVALSAALCAIPGITVPAPAADLDAVRRTHDLAMAWARDHGLQVLEPPAPTYPFGVVAFPGALPTEAIGLVGHLDVVPPREEGQFVPKLDGVDLYARGAADMKTVVATWLVWMAHRARAAGPFPPVLLMLSSCEENGSAAPAHTASTLDWLTEAHGVRIRFAAVGERTGELEWMEPEPVLGPICKENRSWRWLRATGHSQGMATVRAMAEVVRTGRQRVHQLNSECVDPEQAARQPGLRSGFVCPFALCGTEGGDGTWIELSRAPGAAIHSAAAKASDASLLEQLVALADAAEARFGPVRLGALRVGQDGNFNSTDGSGLLRLIVPEEPDAVGAWCEAQDTALDVGLCAPQPEDLPPVLGLDVRELLAHREAVQALLDEVGALLPGWSVERPNDRPPWRCPADHPDLVALEAAWAGVAGAPSPDLVKLHGNDGGSVAERAERLGGPPGVAPAVVFGQVGKRPHGAGEFHRCASVRPYWDVLDAWLG